MRPGLHCWKRYRGGQTTPIWIADLSDCQRRKVPRKNSNDFNPMWVGDKVYFLSDRDGPVTLFAYDTEDARQVKQRRREHGLDFKSASAGPDAIVYEQFGALHLFDLQDRQDEAGRRSRRRRSAGAAAAVRRMSRSGCAVAAISPTGARAVFEARGEILTVPAEKGDVRNLTNTTGVMERDPAWSPDGKTIAYFSDESGEYALHLRPQNGRAKSRRSLGDKPGFYFAPTLVARQQEDRLCRQASQTSGTRPRHARSRCEVDKDHYQMRTGELAPSWSPDSKWLAYVEGLKNHLSAIYLYSVADGKSTQVTDGMSDARYPVFDKDGKYLYFTASTDSGPSMQPDIAASAVRSSRSIYLVVLAKDQPSPFAPESDEEKVGRDSKPEPNTKRDSERPAGRRQAEARETETAEP